MEKEAGTQSTLLSKWSRSVQQKR